MKNEKLLQIAHEKAVEILHDCVTEHGFRASGLSAGYPQIWARDSAITSLGAMVSGDETLIHAIRHSLETLAQHQSPRGLVQLNVNPDTGYVSTENAGAMDANLWYILEHYLYYLTAKDTNFLETHWDSITRALIWLEYQDMNECGLLEIPEAGNWMDLVAVRYNTLYDNTLYYAAAVAYCEMSNLMPDNVAHHTLDIDAGGIHERINLLMWVDRCWVAEHFAEHLDKLKDMRLEWFMLYHNIGTISSRPYYLPYVAFRAYGDWCDTLGNCLAMLTGVADGHHRQHILRYMHQVGIADPYPSKAIHPPIYPAESDWREYYRSRNLNLPRQYHNGGIWFMVGGFHVAALVRHNWQNEAENLLIKLATGAKEGADMDWGFNEWMHGKTGHPMGYDKQAWSAAMYLYAEHAVQTGQLPFFNALIKAKPPSAIAAENNDFTIRAGGGPT
ncbi:MAG: glycoside hydrolase 100 family protein [Anaerolineae bacterium]|nr:glycoside hydrolase 100 family protein [Anaerolineae bacterium]MDQ7036159.1 glycoside hydrolase 100 family protein [Anaerolineae bacterium]